MSDFSKYNKGTKGTEVVARKFEPSHKRKRGGVLVAVIPQFTLFKNKLKFYLVPTAFGN